MQKNTLLAIVFSIVVLFGYETVFVAPKRAEMLKKAQLAKLQQPVEKVASTSSALPATTSETTAPAKEGKISLLSTTNSNFSYTSVGGSLHKVTIAPHHKVLPLTGILDIVGYNQNDFVEQSGGKKSISYLYEDKALRIAKTFELLPNGLTRVRMDIKNVSGAPIVNNFSFKAIGIDSGRMDISKDRETMLDEYSVSAGAKVIRKSNAFKFETKEAKGDLAAVQWVGFRGHYLTLVVKPEFETKGYDIKVVTEKILNIFISAKEETLSPGQVVSYEFSIYAGEQDKQAMKKLGKGIEDIVAFSSFAPLEWVSQAIYYTIPFIYGIVKSWGISVIVIGLIIYGMTYPLTIKSMMSMRKMQEVQPKLLALRERYKKDPQKLNTETMEIYKREKINPLGGCLPFILQMPFFMAIYQVLWRASYFQGKSFLWIKDLSQADKLFVLPFTIPFLGSDFNLLPLLMGVVMFFQQKVSSKSMVVTDETQAMQQKMMLYFFPIFITFIFYKFASSLSLYFTMFYLLSTLTQYKLAKMPIKKA